MPSHCGCGRSPAARGVAICPGLRADCTHSPQGFSWLGRATLGAKVERGPSTQGFTCIQEPWRSWTGIVWHTGVRWHADCGSACVKPRTDGGSTMSGADKSLQLLLELGNPATRRTRAQQVEHAMRVTVVRSRLDASSLTTIEYAPRAPEHIRVVVSGTRGWSEGVSRSLLVRPR